MEDKTYAKIVAEHFECNLNLAYKIIKSAELNNSERELDRIVRLNEQTKG